MCNPLDWRAIEILRGLVLGLSLRLTERGWVFAGFGQNPNDAMPAQEVVQTLLEANCIEVACDNIGQNAIITGEGRQLLRQRTEDMWRWLMTLPENLSF